MRYRIYLLMRAALCRLGLHDYEYAGNDDAGWGKLECFYCQQVKRSMRA